MLHVARSESLRGPFARRTCFGAVPPEIAFRRHLILPQDNACLPGPGQSSAKASRDTGIAQRERRVRTARGCIMIMMVIGVKVDGGPTHAALHGGRLSGSRA
jgi:hypothetical protein